MKQIKTKFLLTLLMGIIGISASAYDFEVDGLCYNYNEGVNGSSVSLTYKSRTPNTYGGNVIIPSKVTFDNHTYNDTGIGEYTFDSCYLTQIAIPPTVTSIGHHAFSYCSELYSITIPNSVTSIEWATFSSCSGLTSVIIPKSVTEIEGYAFAWCSDLASISFSSSVKSIGRYAFDGTLWYKNQSDGLIYAGNVLLGYKNTLPTNVTLREGTLGIAAWAFEGCGTLQSITLPNSLITIGEHAFLNCRGLLSRNISNSVTSIEDYAFWGCSGITSVDIPNSVQYLGKGAFRECI